MNTQKGFVVLESGETFEGRWLGGVERAGEVVFNTSPSGYEEIATDPSYYGQIMVMASSQQGNYGSHPEHSESSKIHLQGFVATEVQSSELESSWLQRLIGAGVPVLDQVDTRKLVLLLRDRGTSVGAVVKASSISDAKEKVQPLFAKHHALEADWTWAVCRKEPEIQVGAIEKGPRVAILDYGVKENTIRHLMKRSSAVGIFPGRTSFEELMKWEPNGFLLSNGPGDPAQVQVAVQTLKQILGQRPVFGICMGHQLLAQALGAKTYRLRFGHRGGNHPVRDSLQNRIYMTSQNHGYAVDPKTFESHVLESHVNLYDKTNEGLECRSKQAFSVQYHPEACPGPEDAESLFDYFMERLR